MKILKTIGLIVLALIALPFIVAIFIPKTYTVSVSEKINRPRQEVYDYMRMLRNQKDYSIWLMQDPSLNPEIIGTDGTVGVIQKWNSKSDKVGEGEQEITALTPDRMDVDLRFKRPFKSNVKAANIFKPVSENETEVTAEYYSNSPYPMNLPSYIFGRKYMEEAQKKNLQNLKNILEKK